MAKNKKETITVNDREYKLSNLNEEQKLYLDHLQGLDRKLNSAKFNLDQLMIGREAFVHKLATSLEKEETPPEPIVNPDI